ncbi:hypothetical protein D3D02_09560 [Halobellus sp. Atlit-38R]|uniref:hypothetical protein n=1 Tax=Halobellus sp. Atlit-38R TaxID=2282131 RepID=UPI000EF251CC|nr:hypothetical protein [Halobellus sp. Atlit-38R]RLM89359.1 hypothetical protein D3D02_09560 [Halobellus sp. Atlit-38R]
MARGSDTARLPLEPLRRQVADATGRSASFIDVTGVEVDGNALEVTFQTPDEDVPVADVVVEGPNGRTGTTPVRLDTPSGVNVFGELLRIEYAGRDAETDEILVSVDQQVGDDWRTLLGCGQMWAVQTSHRGEDVTITCHVETPSDPDDEDGDTAEPETGPTGSAAESDADAGSADDGGLLDLDR